MNNTENNIQTNTPQIPYVAKLAECDNEALTWE